MKTRITKRFCVAASRNLEDRELKAEIKRDAKLVAAIRRDDCFVVVKRETSKGFRPQDERGGVNFKFVTLTLELVD
jgi:hypothetical protein